MSLTAIVMMLLFMITIWGGLLVSYIQLTRADRARTPGQASPATGPGETGPAGVDQSAP